MTEQNPTIEQEILLQIDRQIQFSNELYQDSGSHFYLGAMDALSELRNFILMISIDRNQKPDDIPLVDAVEPTDRIMAKLERLTEAMTITRQLAALAIA